MRFFTMQSCLHFRPVPLLFVVRHLFVCGGVLPPPQISSNKQQSLSNIIAVTVVAVALGCSLCFLFFPAASKRLSAACHPTDQPRNSSTASACIVHSHGAVREVAYIDRSVYIFSPNSVGVENQKKKTFAVVQHWLSIS